MSSSQLPEGVTPPTSRFAEINGLRLHYADWGGDSAQGTIVLLHGGAANSHWWDQVAPRLTTLGRVLALDLRGHGRSQWAQPPLYGPQAYADDVAKFLAALEKPIILIGHSMGGYVAEAVAELHPDLLGGLVIVDTPPGGPPLWRRLKWRWRQRARGGTRPELDSAQDIISRFRLIPPGTCLSAGELAELGLQSAEQLANGKWAFRFDPNTRAWRRFGSGLGRHRPGAIRTPALILIGAKSTLVSPRSARSMCRRIPGAILREIPDAYHHVPLDNPAATADAIKSFVEALRS